MPNRLPRLYKNYIFLIPLFAAALLYQITYSVVAFHQAVRGTTISDFPFDTDNGTVSSVSKDAEKAGLHYGDQILAVDGKELKNSRILVQQIRQHKPKELLTLTVIPKGQSSTRTLRVPVRAASSKPATVGDLIFAGVLDAMALFCVLVGIYVAAILPHDVRAVIFFGLMLSLSQVVRGAGWYDFPVSLWAFAEAWSIMTILSWSVWLVCFGIYFPERFQWDLRRPWLKWLFLSPLILWILLVTVDAVSGQFDFHAFPAALNRTLNLPVFGLFIAGGIAFFFTSLGVKMGTAKNRDSRRRLRILIAGSTIGLVPVGLLILYRVMAHKGAFDQVAEPIVIAVCLLFCLFPLTLAYVIVTERAMDLRMVIRQGVRYTLARGGLRVLLALAASAIIWGLNILVFGSKLSMTAKISITALATIAMVIAIRKTRNRLTVWIDKRYFREAYNAERLLEDLSDTVRSMVDQNELLDTVARRISESLHVPHVAILLQDEGTFRPVYCLGFEPTPHLLLAENSKTVDAVKEAKDPPRIYFDRDDNWVHMTPETELVTLKAMHAQLLLPIGLKNKLLGIFSLGPKLSEEPYARTDVQLLRSVTLQTGLALENSRLMTAVAEEMAKRELLNREIEIAREVQERLFPQRLPAIAGIDYSGACRPALG
ncbi:MAG: PDZ domain-containing protein, partial [Acidobacteriaceae bacterium]|nr:PDZ domain-containing protein [Acidobacteriaceae bacterium]